MTNGDEGLSANAVEALALPEAIAYLTSATGRADLSETDLAELAETLGRLPLALSHGAAYLRRYKTATIKDYIGELDRHRGELRNDAESSNPVDATFRTSLLQAEREAAGASTLMSLAALFAPDEIPAELFQQNAALYPSGFEAVASEQARLDELLGVLDDLSLIDFNRETGTISIHHLVQAAAREALGPEQDALAKQAVAIIVSAFPRPAPETWEQCGRLVPHARALSAHLPAEVATRKLAWLLNAAGIYRREHGAPAEALPLLEASLAIFERLATADPDNTGWQRDLSVAHTKIGDVLVGQGLLPDALAAFQASLAIDERLAMADPGNSRSQHDLSVSHMKIGDVLRAQRNLPAALAAYQASYAIFERLAAAAPENAEWQRDLSVAHDKLGDVLREQGKLREALSAYQASRAIFERLAAADPENGGAQRDLSVAHERIGDVLRAQRKLPAALAAHQAALAIREGLATADAGNARSQHDLSVAHEKLGDVLRAQRNLPAALAAYQASLSIVEGLSTADAGNAEWQRDLSVAHIKIGDALAAQGNLSAALSAYQTAVTVREGLTERDPGNAGWQHALALSHGRVGMLYIKQGQRQLAVKALNKGRDIIARLLNQLPDNPSLPQDVAWFNGQIAFAGFRSFGAKLQSFGMKLLGSARARN